MQFLWFLLVGLAAGWLAEQITESRQYSWLGNLIVGVIGAVIGGFLFGLLGFTASNLLGSLISATVGAVLLLYGLRALGQRGKLPK